MQIIEISRTLSGQNYDNISMRASIAEGEDVLKAALELDKRCDDALNGIYENSRKERQEKCKKEDILRRLDILKQKVGSGEIDELPF